MLIVYLEVSVMLNEIGNELSSQSRRVDIKKLKDFALTLKETSTLRDLLLTENDELETKEFLAKMDVWLKVLRKESS